MFPDLVSVGPLTIHTYGFFVALGFAAGIWTAVKVGKRQGVPSQQVMDMAFLMIVWAIIGSRLFYVFINFSYFKEHILDIIKVWQGGLVFSGGLVATAIAMIWYLRSRRFSFLSTGDLWAPSLALGQGIGRIGCFMAGCCYGRPTGSSWGVLFTNPKSLAPLNIRLYPTQLFEAFSLFAIFLVLIFLHGKRKFEGQIFLWYLILHSTARLFVERLRGDERGLIPGTAMTATQFVALLILLGSVVTLLVIRSRAGKKNKRSTTHDNNRQGELYKEV
jgi:phosphatidylglycerol:prolipoprotein diacylglycerol transferase